MGRARRPHHAAMQGESRDIARLEAQVEALQQRLASLERSELAYRLTVDASADVTMRFDLEAQCTYASAATADVLGYAPEERVGRSGFEIIHPDDMGMPTALREMLLADGTGQKGDRFGPFLARLRHRRGHYLWVESMLAVIRDAAGAVQEFILTSRDAEARMTTEAELRASERSFRELLDGLQVGVLVHDAAGAVVLHNQLALEMLGLSADQLLGRAPAPAGWAMIDEDGAPFTPDRFPAPRVLATGAPLRDLVVGVIRPDLGETVWTLTSATAQRGADDEVRQVVVTFTDITARKRAENTVREQASLLEQLSSPIVPITDGVIALPLIGSLDAARTARLLDALLAGVAARRARIALLDITGVPEADVGLADALSRVTRGVRLLGAELVITGMRPAVAQALVRLGADLRDLVTRSTLQEGLALALARRG